MQEKAQNTVKKEVQWLMLSENYGFLESFSGSIIVLWFIYMVQTE